MPNADLGRPGEDQGVSSTAAKEKGGIVTAGMADTLAIFTDVVLPTVSKGIIIRRPRVVAMAAAAGLDTRAVKRLQRLRASYGMGPILLPIPGRPQAILLDPDHVHRVFAGNPEPFSPASAEKRSALSHFEPDVSLISTPPERIHRRRFNDDVLESACPVHSLADSFLAVAREEMEAMLLGDGQSGSRQDLDWGRFSVSWQRVVRRIVLGDGARDDHELTETLDRLRSAANWGFLHPGRKALAKRLHAGLSKYLAHGETGSLAERAAAATKSDATAPTDQLAHYLFAFDPGGMATFRMLGVLATHPVQRAHVRREIEDARSTGNRDLGYLRACLHESLRLWPTTPAIFRETTMDTDWDGGIMPKSTSVLIYAPFFHRDDETLDFAHRFDPDIWLSGGSEQKAALVPFSGGPGVCPARHLVPMVASAAAATIIHSRSIELVEPRLAPDEPLPGTLDHFSIVLRVGTSNGAE
jgi:cytochrome P450